MKDLYLIIPRWFYEYNLGDSVHWSFAPTVIKKEYPDSKLTVITSGELVTILKDNPLVDVVGYPTPDLIKTYDFWRHHALTSGKELPENIFVLFAEHHPEVWNYWNEHFDFLFNHSTANLLYVNSLLQLGLEKHLYTGVDLFPKIFIDKAPQERNTLAIVPATKLSGKQTPHPGCDGKGFRFNGDNGESWRLFVDTVRSINSKIHILEFSKDFYGFGDEHIGHLPWKDLAYQSSRARVAVLSDGGMHHIFNSQDIEIVLLSAQTINKHYHYANKNTTIYWDLYKKCLDHCGANMRKLTSWRDMRKTCNGDCETVDPKKLAEHVCGDFFNE